MFAEDCSRFPFFSLSEESHWRVPGGRRKDQAKGEKENFLWKEVIAYTEERLSSPDENPLEMKTKNEGR